MLNSFPYFCRKGLPLVALMVGVAGGSPVAAQGLPVADPYAVSHLPPEEILLRQVPYFSQDNQPVASVLQALGRSCGVTIICDKDVKGNVNFEAHNLTLRGVLDALCASEGYFWELEESGYITVRRFKTILYKIEYPQMERSGQTKSTIQLGSTNYSGGENSGSGSGGGRSGGGRSGGSGGEEETASVSVEQKNSVKFWDDIEKRLETFKAQDEQVTIDRFSGVIAVRASQRTHQNIANYIETVNGRINQQVEVIGKIVEVTLDDQNKLGVDWNLVREASWGDLIFGPGGNSFGSYTNITEMNGGQLPGDTFAGTIGMGKIEAVIHALSQQGTLNTVTAPRLVTSNNQTAYIKDSLDQPFFQLDSSTTQSTIGNSSDNLIDSKSYSIETISIGTIIAVTPHVADNGDIKMDITPAITRLKEVLYAPSPDGDPDKRGQSNAPSLYVKQMSSIVTLRSGETAVIGGIISDTEATQTRKVPLFGDLPWVGGLFRTDAKINQKTELVIFVTPRIINAGSTLTPEAARLSARDTRAVRANLNVNGTRPARDMAPIGSPMNDQIPVQSISLID